MSPVDSHDPAPNQTASASGGSWLALVAATTVGVGTVNSLQATVSGERLQGAGEGYRLIVQAYDAASVGGDNLPHTRARPLGSTQRAVSAEDIRRGIRVHLVHGGQTPSAEVQPIVVAWLEPGQPDLEFDGLLARPSPGAAVATARADGDGVQLVLRRAPPPL